MYYCNTRKVLAEDSLSTNNLTNLETSDRLDNLKLHTSQELKLEKNIATVLVNQSVNENDFTTTEVDSSKFNDSNVNNKYQITLSTNSQQIEVSRNAVDLLAENSLEKQFLIGKLGLDTLCRAFPLNSRCTDYQTSEQQAQRSI
ncbi:hypothetical protein [Gloeocapsopsis sp. IPPAS B-1203]|uniref:hypothetical protein n=1 Tax=Gloeocapsopsis sp. IPPAS B-1203 TaxID=2049454 RepID=UPI000C199CCA|nr:hypothetical protein [Gloeocapsopsis sp. IPPAS B-1203]PIG93692.1 hypothetical protein CSQ79_08650 [Gloeocapsopsis sp. IPPAS B-1203]